MNNKGFTLIEMTVVLLFIPVILSITLILLNLMDKKLPAIINQEDIFQLQVKQLMLRSNHISFDEKKITFMYSEKEFEISYHNNRLVKRPGYEILLMDVIAVRNDVHCFVVITKSKEVCIEK